MGKKAIKGQVLKKKQRQRKRRLAKKQLLAAKAKLVSGLAEKLLCRLFMNNHREMLRPASVLYLFLIYPSVFLCGMRRFPVEGVVVHAKPDSSRKLKI